ncbi:MAG: SMP-30/gluconolactonase/LRE family protein [Synergistetes bacterium]|nr:SMP-30/gluconolactonase/LRE family protein [Synergistota bacterium]
MKTHCLLRIALSFFLFFFLFLIKSEIYASTKTPPPLPGLVPPEQIAPPRGIKRDPVRALGEFKNGLEAFWLGKYDEALKNFDQAIKADLYALEPYYWKGLIYLRQGALEEAKRMFELYLEVKPADLRLIRALEKVNKTVFPRLSIPQFLFPKNYIMVNPIDMVRENKGILESLRNIFINPVYNASAMALGPDDNLYIADYGRGKIFVLTREGIPIRSWGGLKNPSGIAVSLDGRVYVSDFSESKVFIFDLSGKLINSFGEGELLNPQGLAIDPYGYLYVCDWGNHRICRYTLDGKLVRTIGEGVLWEPLALCVDDKGDIWVSDGSERCVFKFGWDGLLKGRFLEDVFSRGLSLDFKNRVIVADEERKCFFLIDKDKVVEKVNVSKVSALSSLCLDRFGNIFLVDFDRFLLYKVETPLHTGEIEIRIAKLNIKENLEREVEIEVSEGWYPLPLEKIGLFVRIIEGDWIIEPSAIKEIDKPLAIGVIADPAFEREIEEVLKVLKLRLFAIDEAFVVGAFSSSELPISRWVWEKSKEPFNAKALLDRVLRLLVQKDRERVLLYCGNLPVLSEAEMRKMAYFMRKHQIRLFIISDKEPDPSWESLMAYTGGRFWNIFYIDKEMPIAYHLRRSPYESYLVSYTSLSRSDKEEARKNLRVFIEMPTAHYEDEVTYYSWGEPEKVLR